MKGKQVGGIQSLQLAYMFYNTAEASQLKYVPKFLIQSMEELPLRAPEKGQVWPLVT